MPVWAFFAGAVRRRFVWTRRARSVSALRQIALHFSKFFVDASNDWNRAEIENSFISEYFIELYAWFLRFIP